jgi:hypothetical protein
MIEIGRKKKIPTVVYICTTMDHGFLKRCIITKVIGSIIVFMALRGSRDNYYRVGEIN